MWMYFFLTDTTTLEKKTIFNVIFIKITIDDDKLNLGDFHGR